MNHWKIEAQLILDSALHIGVGKGGVTTDSSVRRNGHGQLLLPGRALGGSLRTLATQIAPRFGYEPCQALYAKPQDGCACPVCNLFGTVTFASDSDTGHASSLWVYDATATASTYIRDGVGINRQTGVAATNIKYDFETIPAATQFNIAFRLQPLRQFKSENFADMQTILMLTLSEWEAGRGQLGGNVVRGLGRFHLEGLTVEALTVDSAETLIAFLKDKQSRAVYQDVKADWCTQVAAHKPVALNDQTDDLPVANHFVAIDFNIHCTNTFLINDPLPALISGFDLAPLITMLTTPDNAPGKPVLSGSSLRGALRSHAEKIGRTLATEIAQSDKEFLNIVPAGNPFATIKEDLLATWDRVDQKKVEEIEKRDGEVSVKALHLADRLFGNQLVGSRLWVRDAEMVGEMPTWQAQEFLAVDPFTGGGKEGAKFDAAPLMGTTFRGQIVLYAPQIWELGWLALILRDLAEGHLTIGFGKAKGYGQAHLQNVSWQVGFIHPDDIDFLEKIPADLVRSGVYETWREETAVWLPDSWQENAQHWLDAFIAKIEEGYSAPDWLPPEKDSYFGTMLERLYPKATTEITHEQ